MRPKTVFLLASGVALVSVAGTVTVTNYLLSSSPDPGILHNSSHTGRHDMTFDVAASLDKLEFTSEKRCKKIVKKNNQPGERGCFKVKKNQRGGIIYKFAGESGWVLESFQICKGIAKNKNCSPANLPSGEFMIAANSFATTLYAPDDDGSINLTGLPVNTDGSVDFYLFDENSTEEDYFYSIEACHETLPCIWTDPPIINRGRGGY